MSKLTHKEHAARAMLMGLVYDWRDGTYCTPSSYDGMPTSTGMICADTLELVVADSIKTRQASNPFYRVDSDMPYDEPPNVETPWALPDEVTP